jgi:hypothetical protein
MIGRRGVRAVRLAGLLLVLTSLRAAPSVAQAGGDELVGYDAMATGMAFTLSPSVPALLPMDVPAEATVSLATATLSSGGQGFGRASTFFPGTPIAGIRPLIEIAAGVRLPIPDYPLVVESREFEDAKHNEQPGVTMSTDVDPERAVAIADAGGIAIPGVFAVRSSRTVSTSLLEGGGVTGTSTSTVEGIDLGGMVQIDSIVSTATVVTDAVTATCDGGVVVNGVTVDGQPATIDEDGLHLEDEPALPTGPLAEVLRPDPGSSGVTVEVLGGSDGCAGATGTRSSAGLLVSIPLPAVGAVPPGGHLDVIIASVSASAGASTLPAFEPPPFEALPLPGGGGLEVPALSDGAVGLAPAGTPSAPPGPSAAAPPRSAPLTTEAVAYSFAGVPAPLLAGLLLLALPASRRITRYMERVLRLVEPT